MRAGVVKLILDDCFAHRELRYVVGKRQIRGIREL